jgi:hypothetical protein
VALSLEKLFDVLGVSPEEALAAAVSQFSPVQPSVLRDNWIRSDYYGNSAPATADIDKIFRDSGYRCQFCKRRSQLTLTHIDGEPTNHAIANLRVLCRTCKSTKEVEAPDRDHQLRILTAAFELWEELGQFPTHDKIKQRADVKQIGGATYKLRWLEFVLNEVRPN